MQSVLVTGGGGFVGLAIIRLLCARNIECIALGRNHYPAVEEAGGRCLTGDICDLAFMEQACASVDTVIHVASLAGIWGSWLDYQRINVQGTENVIAACRKNGVARLVYTSTPSVVFDSNDICGGDETLAYPTRFLCHYARSKAIAEQLVLKATGATLKTCAIRPHLVWGPGDPHLIPRLMARGRAGQLKQVGDGKNMVDISYVDNVAYAHLLAVDNLETSATAAGRAYFISQAEPVNLWQWIGELFHLLEVPPVSRRVSFPVAYGAGSLLEAIYSLFKIKTEPKMTRFLAEQLAKSHYFSNAAASDDLGYSPVVSTAQGLERTIDFFRKQSEKQDNNNI